LLAHTTTTQAAGPEIGHFDSVVFANKLSKRVVGGAPMLQRPNQVLVIDDDEAAREILVELLLRVGYHAFAAPDGRSGLEQLSGAAVQPQAVLLDLRMPGIDGFEVLRRYRAKGGTASVIVMSAMDEPEAVVKAMRLGASDYLVKPIEPEQLKDALERAVASAHAAEAETARAETAHAQASQPPPPPATWVPPSVPPAAREFNGAQALSPSQAALPAMTAFVERTPSISLGGARRGAPADYVSQSPAMANIWDMVDRVAETDVPVLIRGESGVGKEGIARTIHERSVRRGKPFVKINCAALPSELLESELFGHERGAFTGATSEKPGKFELADKGTIFLDEIGEMHPALQAKLLTVLQDEEYYRVGGKRPLRADARVVVATNRVLEEEIDRGNFREDLYYRLNVVSVSVPPLRERREDIAPLIEFFRRKYGSKYKQGPMDFSGEILRKLLDYDFPGNVRELENLVRRLVVLRDERFVMDELAAAIARRPSHKGQVPVPAGHVGGSLPPPVHGYGRDTSPYAQASGYPQQASYFQAPAQSSTMQSQPPPPTPVPQLSLLGAETVSLKDIARQAAVRAEREAIGAMLARTNWNKRKAAVRLQISYKALLYKIKDCGLTDPRITAGMPDLPPLPLAANGESPEP
jgi:two-component system, NtrC family, response regulator AtoC